MISGEKARRSGEATPEPGAHTVSRDKRRVSLRLLFLQRRDDATTCHTPSPSKFSQYPFPLSILRKVPCIPLPVLIAPGTLPCADRNPTRFPVAPESVFVLPNLTIL